jgi:hypothetical protein
MAHDDPVLAALCRGREPWWQVSLIAGRQGQAISVAQLRDCEIPASTVKTATRRGRLHRSHRGVRIFGATALAPAGERWAAHLAAGPGSAFTLDTGAGLTGIGTAGRHLHLVAPKGRRDHRRVTVHECAGLGPEWICVRQDLPVLRPAHLLLDLATVLRPDALAIALNEAVARRLVTHDEVEEAGAARPRHRGRRPLDAAVFAQVADPGEGRTKGELEALVLPLIRALPGLPPYVRNDLVELGGGRFATGDLHFRGLGVLVELHSRTWHEQRLAMDDDRRRDQQALAAGFVVFRVTWRHVTVEWTAVAADLLDLLARRTVASATRSSGEARQAA